ncbi:MAG TPA: NAD(P)/FAD-dependent oxidoreductase, partial [Dehalococcoidia bacterium]|nr:NAD(P)/FAD-dependent oxidoreductase [Dehalococcoidia bacterium]
MTDLTDRHVIVVGAAIGGAAAALLLARAGARITLLERVAEPAAVGAGIALQPNGLSVLYGLGLRDALQRTGCPATFFGVRDAAGRVLTSGLVPAGGHGLDHILIIRRSHLLAALHEAVRAQPGLDLRLGTEVVRATTAGEVTVRGPAGEVSLRGDLVIGADGVHSVTRRSGSFGDRERRTGVSYVRALTPHSLPAVPAGETWSPLGIFGHFPVEDGTYFYTSAAAPDVRRALDRRSLPTFQAAWEAVYPPAGPLIAALGGFDDLLINEVIRVDCDRLADGRLVLLGDAAHAMAPNLGQGANSALVDVAILIEELSRRPDLHAALAVYDARRRRAVR